MRTMERGSAAPILISALILGASLIAAALLIRFPLDRTVDELTSVMIDPAARIEKTRFSASVDLVEERLRNWRRTSVLVCGVEAHVCVAQTVLDLQASGRQCFVVSDAIAASQVDQVAPAIRRMESAGAVTTGVMAAMYELLGDAAHPARRACVELAKQIHV